MIYPPDGPPDGRKSRQPVGDMARSPGDLIVAHNRLDIGLLRGRLAARLGLRIARDGAPCRGERGFGLLRRASGLNCLEQLEGEPIEPTCGQRLEQVEQTRIKHRQQSLAVTRIPCPGSSMSVDSCASQSFCQSLRNSLFGGRCAAQPRRNP